MVGAVQLPISLSQQRIVLDGMFDWETFLLVYARLHEIDQGQSLAIKVGVNDRLVGLNRRRRHGAGCWSDGIAQICAREIFANAFKSQEEKRFVTTNGTTDRAAELFAMKIFQLFPIRCVRRQCFQTLKVKQTAVNLVRP